MSDNNGKKKEEDKGNQQQENNDNNGGSGTLTATELAIIDMMKRQNLQVTTTTAAASIEDKKHAFWDTQPMPHGGDHPEGPISPNKPQDEIRAEPYSMPKGFVWSNVNVKDDTERLELYNLLSNNYVEDDDALFRFDYSQDFLTWALTPPGFNPDFLFGVKSASNDKLVAFISGIPAKLQVYEKTIDIVEINFLCVHKKLRSKRLAPVLIKEVTRRVNLTGVFQAIYTAGTVLPVPVASTRYYHRSLNIKKLVKVGFSRLGPRVTLAKLVKKYKLPTEPLCNNGGSNNSNPLQLMQEQHVDGVHKLLTEYLSKFQLKLLFSPDEVRHWLLPIKGVISSYVITDKNDKTKVTDLVSFYHLPSSVLNHNETLFAAYSYYNVATTVPLVDLMKDALILAKNEGSDVFNALNLMDNTDFLETLQFGKGDGFLQYYIYNWACPKMEHNNVGVVLL